MNYEDFARVMQAQIQERLGEQAQIKRHEVVKNNGVRLDALSISEGDSRFLPTVYLNEYYPLYLDGAPISKLTDQIEARYRRNRVKSSLDLSFFNDYEKVKDRLACRLVNYRKNEELLREVPHMRFLDLAAVVYYLFEDDQLGTGTVLVRGEHKESWRVTQEELFEAARANTLRLLPADFMSLKQAVERQCALTEEQQESACSMYVLTNRENYFGAGCLLFDSVLQEIGQKLREDFWVLPSSVHECIIIPESYDISKEALSEMVRDINRCGVAQEDFLSDEVYCYKRAVHKLSL